MNILVIGNGFDLAHGLSTEYKNFLEIINLDYCNISIEFYITIVAQVIISIFCVYIFINKRPDYLIVKERYIREWQEIQKNENSLK